MNKPWVAVMKSKPITVNGRRAKFGTRAEAEALCAEWAGRPKQPRPINLLELTQVQRDTLTATGIIPGLGK